MLHVESTPTVMDALAAAASPLGKPPPSASASSQSFDGSFLSLDADVMHSICAKCDAADLLALSCVCRALSALIDNSPSIWEPIMLRRHQPIIDALFDGSVPLPPPGRSAKCHAYEFDSTWLDLARRRSDRVLLCMSCDCASSDPAYLGVPPRRDVFVHVRVPVFDVVLPIRLGLLSSWYAEPRFGIYDATPFLELHPGAEQLLNEAAREADCTQSFDAANHSERARRILRRLAVPGLESLSPPPPLVRPRPSALAASAARALRKLRELPGRLWAVAVARAVAQLAGRGVSGPDIRARDAIRAASPGAAAPADCGSSSSSRAQQIDDRTESR